MAVGLKTSPCTFQRLMNNVMIGIIDIKCLVYLNDIIINGKNLTDHNIKLRDIPSVKKHSINLKKTFFFVSLI